MNIFTRRKDAEIARLRAELATLRLQVDDLLDRESMHVYDSNMEQLTTAALVDLYGAGRAHHHPSTFAAIQPTMPSPGALI